MEVNSVAVKKKSFKFKKDDKILAATLGQLIKEKRCLRCGEEGHRYVQYSNPPKDFERQGKNENGRKSIPDFLIPDVFFLLKNFAPLAGRRTFSPSFFL